MDNRKNGMRSATRLNSERITRWKSRVPDRTERSRAVQQHRRIARMPLNGSRRVRSPPMVACSVMSLPSDRSLKETQQVSRQQHISLRCYPQADKVISTISHRETEQHGDHDVRTASILFAKRYQTHHRIFSDSWFFDAVLFDPVAEVSGSCSGARVDANSKRTMVRNVNTLDYARGLHQQAARQCSAQEARGVRCHPGLHRLGRSLKELLETVDKLRDRQINLISLEK